VQEQPRLELTISPDSVNPSSCVDETGRKVLPGTIEIGRLMNRRPHSVKPLKHPMCVSNFMVPREVDTTAKEINEGTKLGFTTVAMPSK